MDSYANDHFPEAVKVVSRLRERGFQAFFAGGYYRDRFLGKHPNDVDVATSARPEEVRPLFSRTIPVGEQFGIVIAQFGDEKVEIATFREDEGYSDGRRPDRVKFTDAQADAQRRDFTINGIFWDPVAQEAHDYIGGQEDLVRGIVRAIGSPDARFDEDKLRMLRAPRFAARLGFRIDPATAEAARRRAREVAIVSSERLHDELQKMLMDPHRARAIDLVVELGLVAVVLPELDEKALALARRTLAELPRKVARPLAWAALVIGATPDAAEAALTRLRSSVADREAVKALVRDVPRARRIGELGLADQKRLLLREDARDLLELARAVAVATDGDLEGVRVAHARREAFLSEKGPSALGGPPLVTGNDLKTLGLRPGPHFKHLLARAEEARLEGRALSKEELVRLLREESPELFVS